MAPLTALIKYDSPVLVGAPKDGKGKGGDKDKSARRGSLPPVEQKGTTTQTEDILNSILPPRELTEDGQLWVQYVSSTPATRLDVIALQERLDHQLQQRQVTINCAERGLLLLRMRDELRMSMAAYQTLYESSVAFGMRKALLAEQGKGEMAARIEALETSERELAKQAAEWKLKCEMAEKRESERRESEAKKHKEETAYLESYARQLKGQLEALTNPAGKKGGAIAPGA